MSTALEAASLVMVPSGYEDGTLASVKPNDGTGDFTFSRGSNTSATRVNADGYIEKGYENLLLQSNSFDTTWASNPVLTPNQLGYDGSNDAWLVEKLAAFNNVGQSMSLSGVQTFSAYAKAGTQEWIRLRMSGSQTCYYHLFEDGYLGSNSGTISQSINSIGNGWYRCSMTINATTSSVNIYSAEDDGVMGAAGSIYIQDAMLNQGLVAYPYIETTTAPVAGGILEDMPRLDYSNGSCPALLLEPQRTNAIAHSEYIGNTTNSTISRNDGVSPEGVENASKVTITGTSQAGITTSNAYVSLSTTYTQSCYVKKDVGDYFGFGLFQSGMPINNNNYVRWNLSDINATPSIQGSYTNAKAEDAGNGWIRLSATIITTSSSTRSGWKFLGMTSSNNFQTSAVGDSFYLYGLQAEPDATYPTSYIPTYGVSQTRADDFFDSSADFTNFFGNDQGTIYIETNERLFKDETSNEEFIGFRDDTKYWRIIGANNVIFTQSVNWGSTILHYPSATNPTKYLFKWDGSNVSFYIDGSLVGTAAQTATFNPNQFGRGGNGVSMNSEELLNQFTLFPTALTDSECIELTTI